MRDQWKLEVSGEATRVFTNAREAVAATKKAIKSGKSTWLSLKEVRGIHPDMCVVEVIQKDGKAYVVSANKLGGIAKVVVDFIDSYREAVTYEY